MTDFIRTLPVLIVNPYNRCNCRCVMCDIWKIDTTDEINAAELERHMQDIVRLGVEWIVFSGGEPLSVEDVERLLVETVLAQRPLEVALPFFRGALARVATVWPQLAPSLRTALEKKGRAAQARRKKMRQVRAPR